MSIIIIIIVMIIIIIIIIGLLLLLLLARRARTPQLLAQLSAQRERAPIISPIAAALEESDAVEST